MLFLIPQCSSKKVVLLESLSQLVNCYEEQNLPQLLFLRVKMKLPFGALPSHLSPKLTLLWSALYWQRLGGGNWLLFISPLILFLVKKHFSKVPSSHPVYLFSPFLIVCLSSLSCMEERKISRMMVCLRSKPYFCLVVSLFRNYLKILVCFFIFSLYFLCAVEQNVLSLSSV